jgi:hypothetical protein
VPPFACTFVFSIVTAYFCDKYKNRGLTAIICGLFATAGFAMVIGPWFAIQYMSSEAMVIGSRIQGQATSIQTTAHYFSRS